MVLKIKKINDWVWNRLTIWCHTDRQCKYNPVMAVCPYKQWDRSPGNQFIDLYHPVQHWQTVFVQFSYGCMSIQTMGQKSWKSIYWFVSPCTTLRDSVRTIQLWLYVHTNKVTEGLKIIVIDCVTLYLYNTETVFVQIS